MNEINLLPDKHKKSLKIVALLKKAITLEVIAFFIIILCAIIIRLHSANLQKELSLTNEYLLGEKYILSDKLVEELNLFDKKTSDLSDLLNNIGQLDTISDKLIKYFLSILPANIFIQTISFYSDTDRIIFSGISRTIEHISILTQTLADTRHFDDIVITNISIQNSETVLFSLELYYVGGKFDEN